MIEPTVSCVATSVRALMRGIGALSLMTVAACADCDVITSPSVCVTVIDGATGRAPTSTVRVTVFDGTAEESAFPSSASDSLPRFSSRTIGAGVFRLNVTADGYVPFVQENIRVSANECGNTEQVRVAGSLQPR